MTIDELEGMLDAAKFPEDIFGWDSSRVQAVKIYKRCRSLVHEDKFTDMDMKIRVGELFKRLHVQWDAALSRFSDGAYGDKSVVVGIESEFVVKSKMNSYIIESILPDANLCKVFKTACGRVLKIARSHIDNDLLEVEAATLKRIGEDPTAVEFGYDMVGKLVESFKIKNKEMEKVVVNVIEYADDHITLKQLKELNGEKPFDPRHIIWLWKRILCILGFIHNADLVHGAILPSNIMLHPESHGVKLIDFCYSVKSKETLKVIDSQYVDFYPPEISSENHTNEVDIGFDIYMSGKCMIYLLGGDVKNNTLPDYVPKRLKNVILSSVVKNKYARYDDAWKLYDIVSARGKDMFGSPKFVELKI